MAPREMLDQKPPATFAGALAAGIRRALQSSRTISWPSEHYRKHPVLFCREILGVEPWAKQIEILEAVRDNKRVAVSSGHKVGKSRTAVMLALWYWCTHPDARVIMTATTAFQVRKVLWRELRIVHRSSGRCVACLAHDVVAETRGPRPCLHSAVLEAEPAEQPQNGLVAYDFREIFGFTAREPEGIAGTSGRSILYLVDEASGVDEDAFKTMEGNMAAGGKLAMFSNPTRTSGFFFAAFHDPKKSARFVTITISSEDTPNAREGRDVIPGLAGQEWIADMRAEYGETHPFYLVRVKGQFPLDEAGRIFSVHAIAQAQARHRDLEAGGFTTALGPLFVGVDPAGESGMGDETAIAVRRGLIVRRVETHRGLSATQIASQVLAVIREFAEVRETPIVVVDALGAVGAKLVKELAAMLPDDRLAVQPFRLVKVYSHSDALQLGRTHRKVRDELTASFEQWVRAGGAIPADTKLEQEMHALEWETMTDGRLRVTPKDALRDMLDRSPDRYDAVVLACWETSWVRAVTAREAPEIPMAPELPAPHELVQALQREPAAFSFDPYGGTYGGSR